MSVAINPELSQIFGNDDDVCPVCLDPLPVSTFRGTERHRSLCCGKLVCKDCMGNIHEHQRSLSQRTRERAEAAVGNPMDMTDLVESMRVLEGSTACPMCRAPTPTSAKEAFDMTMKHAKKGRAWAQHHIAYKYENGVGVATDKREAAKWFEMAARQGHPWSMSSFGRCLETGDGIRKSVREAKSWYEKSAQTGYAIAQYYLAMMYLNGSSEVPKNLSEAVRLLQLSAEQGFDPAECSLGNCYDHAEGVPRDLDKALLWYTRAAEQGNATAMHNVGATLMGRAMMKYGSIEIAGKSPVPLAMKWARKAAAKGDHDATQVLAQMEAALSGACANCKASKPANGKLLRCAKCKAMHYCSKACQVQHWKAGHKIDCCQQD